ncbi:DinB family protein [Solitalea canadensis]|uniref:DinB family protein n=1 Tax=Solitalea canadensis (strain ATCC 29591 / DSM 3403 / JCM 21819 / LMG 8368 / NBRC 15130 / NCIMB 12057 / USAM 9D) TaxID=929556 RepID=H8KNS0_SOLCM|nr:DinB family protein [Solitalea canadensis]AFD05177.1 DinB family protein [Solitalea canadensis DSM 3403]
MFRKQTLIEELNAAISGDPWHGSSLYDLLNNITWQSAIAHPIKNAHSIAELVLHIIAWTEEVTSRLNGTPPGMPQRGDWPDPDVQDETNWQFIMEQLFNANEALVQKLETIPESFLLNTIGSDRDAPLGTGITYEAMLHGLAQHHAYHGGQIALLSKFF